MFVKMPCKLGEEIIMPDGKAILDSVSWFKWTEGWEFTYIFNSETRRTIIVSELNPDYDTRYEINNLLIEDNFLKDFGYPLKGKGYLYGFRLINNQLMGEIILTDKYMSHIYISCWEDGTYKSPGSIFVPPSWDTIEKKQSILLKKFHDVPIFSIGSIR